MPDPLKLIKKSISDGQVFWTYHVNMRLGARSISRQMILDAVDTLEVIEEYPQERYLPSYLVRGVSGMKIIHALIEVDEVAGNIRIVTAYYPDQDKWDEEFRGRRKS